MEISKDRKTALLTGATGLVGQELLLQLLEHPAYEKVRVFSRRPPDLQHERLEVQLIDFDELERYADLFRGDDLYSALGTTIKQAGSQEAFYKVDFTYNFEIARLARANGVKQYLLVSSVGADAGSRFFYPRVKGELEEAVQDLNFWALHIFQPSMLLGERSEMRVAEAIAQRLSLGLDRLTQGKLLKQYRPVEAAAVARAMIRTAQQLQPGIHNYPSHIIHQLAT
jgi:uncharacterized protein YbjT (DUF2867 family)